MIFCRGKHVTSCWNCVLLLQIMISHAAMNPGLSPSILRCVEFSVFSDSSGWIGIFGARSQKQRSHDWIPSDLGQAALMSAATAANPTAGAKRCHNSEHAI